MNLKMLDDTALSVVVFKTNQREFIKDKILDDLYGKVRNRLTTKFLTKQNLLHQIYSSFAVG